MDFLKLNKLSRLKQSEGKKFHTGAIRLIKKLDKIEPTIIYTIYTLIVGSKIKPAYYND